MRDLVIALDASGQVVWFIRTTPAMGEVHPLPGGRLFGRYNDRTGAAELDMFGTTSRRWHVAGSAGVPGSVPVAVDSFHHELFTLGTGNLLGLSSERRVFAGYPTSEIDPTPQSGPVGVGGDVVVEVAPDGTVVRRISLFDVLDPYRIGYGSFGTGNWSPLYQVQTLDWSHGNAVTPDPAGGYLVSLRHQDAVVKLDAGGALVWILGPHDNWGHRSRGSSINTRPRSSPTETCSCSTTATSASVRQRPSQRRTTAVRSSTRSILSRRRCGRSGSTTRRS
jgi:hypothetical protein